MSHSQNYFVDKTLHKETRYNHAECGDRRARLYVKYLGHKWQYHCHNCGYGGIKYQGITTPTDTVARARSMGNLIHYPHVPCSTCVKLPNDVTTKLPPTALTWLRSASLTDEEIKQFGICYSPRYNRLILPVYVNGNLSYYQARNLGTVTKESPKYLNIRAKDAKNIYFMRNNVKTNYTKLCIVEDILSAIRVGRCVTTMALLGSYLPDTLLPIIGKYDKIYVWLDYDKLATAIKIAKHIRLLTGKAVTVVTTTEDPKYVTDNHIKEKLI